MLKYSIKYSIICGVFLIALFFVSIQFGTSPFLDIRHFLVDTIIFSLFVFFAVKEYKSYHNDGFLHFWQGMTIGFIVYLPAVLIFCVVLFIIMETNPSYLMDYKYGAIEMLENQKTLFLEKFPEEQFDLQLAAIHEVTTVQLIFDTLGKKILAGFFISPVVSIILRKKPK